MSANQVTGELVSRLPGLNRLWSITKGSQDICVAILDGPVDAEAIARPEVIPAGVVEHGTHVYSILAGSGDGLVPGIAPGCRFVSVPIFDAAATDRRHACSQHDLAAGIRKALDAGANILNVSASQQADLLSLSTELSGALQEAAGRDALVVAAAGNQGCACDTIPASVAGVLAVGAHDKDGFPLLSSNWGPNQRSHGVTAPGSDIPGACVGGGVCRASGTSFAAAMVSGVAALLMSVEAERGLKPSGAKVRKILLASCAPPSDDRIEIASTQLAGRLDVGRALDLLLGPSATLSEKEDPLTTSSLPRIETYQPQSIFPQGQEDDASASGSASNLSQDEALVPAHGDCGCGCGGQGGECTCGGAQKTQLVYAIGRLGVSFISQTRRDSIWRLVNGSKDGDLKPISDEALQKLFQKQAFQSQSVVWTLSRTEVPMYAIAPAGAFAAETYAWLVSEWSDKTVEFVSLPGVMAGSTTLYDGQPVDVVMPDLRGMYSWAAKKYVAALTDARKKAAGVTDEQAKIQIDRFLGKIYFSIRNRGLSPEERALNAAATNAFNFSPVIVEAGKEGLSLRDIGVERSPLNRPGSEYFDVLLTFFDPTDRLGRAPLRARFTIDVADTVPVMIGEPATWYEY